MTLTTLTKKLYKIILDLWVYKKSFLFYQIITQGITTILLIPIMGLIVNSLMAYSGNEVLTNGLITKFLFTPYGILALVICIALATIVTVIELGGLILLSANAYHHRKINPVTIFFLSLKRFKNMIGLGGLLVLFIFLIVSPWLDLGINTSFISHLQIPGFIMSHIQNNQLLNISLKLMTFILALISFFLVFSLHLVILDNQKSKLAILESIHMVKNNFVLILKLALAYVIFSLLLLGGFLLISLIGIILISLIPSITPEIIQILAIALFIILSAFTSLLALPIHIHLLTIAFYTIHPDRCQAILATQTIKKRKTSIKSGVFFILTTGTILCVAILFTLGMISFINETRYDIDITAHRGSSMEAPENTIAGLNRAILNGADYAEIDVQLTQDEEVVLIHDTSLMRTTGIEAQIYEYTLSEVQALDAGSWFSSEFKGEVIPTLEEVIRQTKGKIKLNIELKGHKESKNLVHKVVDLIKKYDLVNQCVVTSLDYALIQEVESREPSIRTGYVIYLAYGNLNTLQTDFYSIEASNITESFVTKAHQIGREVHVWTVNDTDQLQNLADLGIDNIITDYEKKMRSTLDELSNEDEYLEKIINLFIQ